jgi:hypothetical protein
MACHFDKHPTEEQWEEYALGLLSEEQIAGMEEHLLVCPECQDRLSQVDEYIHVMREAARKLSEAPPPWWRLAWARLEAWRPMPAVSWGLAAAAVVVLFLLVPRIVMAPRSAGALPVTVMLQATRSAGGELFAQAPSGRDLRLTWDPTGLPSESCCQVEVVDAGGRVIAQARVEHPREAELRLRSLRRGTYWVRVYSLGPGRDLIREFGLEVR